MRAVDVMEKVGPIERKVGSEGVEYGSVEETPEVSQEFNESISEDLSEP